MHGFQKDSTSGNGGSCERGGASPEYSPVQWQDAICFPRLFRTHKFILHHVPVRQQPQKTQLGNAAECELFVLKIAEPVPRYAVMGVSFRGEGNPDVDVRHAGHQIDSGWPTPPGP